MTFASFVETSQTFMLSALIPDCATVTHHRQQSSFQTRLHACICDKQHPPCLHHFLAAITQPIYWTIPLTGTNMCLPQFQGLPAGQDGNLCVYEVAHSYLPIKFLSTATHEHPACIAVSSDSALLATVSRSEASPYVRLSVPSPRA